MIQSAKEMHGVQLHKENESRDIFFIHLQNGHDGSVSIAVYGLDSFDALINGLAIAKESPLTARLLTDVTYLTVKKEPNAQRLVE
jgi:hypothetical protein